MEKDNPLMAIMIFLSVCIAVPILDSPRVSTWSEAFKGNSIFHVLVANDAAIGDGLRKSGSSLGEYLRTSEESWRRMKQSPIVKSTTLIEFRGEEEEGVGEGLVRTVVPALLVEKEAVSEEVKVSEEVVVEEEVLIQEEVRSKIEGPFKILVVGDSFVAVGGGLGEPLERNLLSYEGVTVKRHGVVSTGLYNVKYYDWKVKIQELIKDYDPDIVIAFFGTNDSQGYINDKWNQSYAVKADAFMKILDEKDIMTFWIGLPIMKKESLSKAMQNINNILEGEAGKHDNIYYIPTWSILADEKGQYLSSIKDDKGVARLLRLKDGIHLQYFAGEIVSKEIIEEMGKYLVLKKKL
ncbi:MAG: hypothetical protein MNSN_07060 [Minisyncoccus archaeiphilus]|uniref:DUF459 domain-containing protein n=1 Tax=Minisyncoccus archaeiphilus TaxID=3238481 RepID=UPI002B14BDFE|nr:MAG: hypothetical protein MNSN_07060 [Candidatus Parcubacteria bacterium]